MKTSSQPLFDRVFAGSPEPKGPPLTGADLRDSGMASVMAHTSDEWKEKLRSRIRGFPRGYKFTMDRIVDELGGRPSDVHQNAVGAMTAAMARQGLMRRTGETVKAERPSLHATDCVVWERL